ncbi:MAG: TRL-like family protein [Polyangiaceae bacterium]
MMKRMLMVVAAAAGLTTLSGCASFAGLTGEVYSGYVLGASAGAGSGTKTGEACAMSILGVVAIGDASIDLAKSNGGVSQVASVDHKVFSILGIYANVCTVVHGS